MKLVRWDPFGREFAGLASRLNRAFDPRFWDDEEQESQGRWNPPVDIYEDEDNIVLKAELPGLKKDEIDVHVEKNLLTLNGERKREKETKENGYYRSERAYGNFSRSFTLPTTVDASKIAATYTDGLLTLTLPKVEQAKPRQIEVKVA